LHVLLLCSGLSKRLLLPHLGLAHLIEGLGLGSETHQLLRCSAPSHGRRLADGRPCGRSCVMDNSWLLRA
jgi:hypothetical protein